MTDSGKRLHLLVVHLLIYNETLLTGLKHNPLHVDSNGKGDDEDKRLATQKASSLGVSASLRWYAILYWMLTKCQVLARS